MKKVWFAAVLVSVALVSGCGKAKTETGPKAEKTAAQDTPNRPLRCRRPVFRVSLAPVKQVYLSELAQKGAKKMQLVSIEHFSTVKITRGKTSNRGVVHMKSLVSPAATTENLEAINSIVCQDLDAMPEGRFQSFAQVPFLVDLTDLTKSPAIKTDLELGSIVYGSKRSESTQLTLRAEAPQVLDWNTYLQRMSKEADQYSLYEVSPGRLALTVQKVNTSSKYDTKAELTQINEFDLLTHMEFLVE